MEMSNESGGDDADEPFKDDSNSPTSIEEDHRTSDRIEDDIDVPEFSKEDAEQHNKLTNFLWQINSDDSKRPNTQKDAKSVMTYKTYMSNLEVNPSDLENTLTPRQLDSILLYFETHATTNIDLPTFQHAVIESLESSEEHEEDTSDSFSFSDKASQLFGKIDWLGSGFITPQTFCEFFINRLINEKKADKLPPLNSNEKIVQFPFLKACLHEIFVWSNKIFHSACDSATEEKGLLFQEVIVKILIDINNPLKYILVTKDCQIFNISSNLTLKSNVNVNGNSSVEAQKKRWLKTNVTDAICLPVNKLVVATANRDLQFYDMATSMYMLQFHLIGLPSCVLCMFEYFQKLNSSSKLLLFFGTDYGYVHLLTFHMAEKSLFETPFQKAESSWKILFCDLQNHSRFVSHKTFNIGQSDWVQQISYIPECEQVISACLASTDSLVFHPVNEQKGKSYRFSVSKGVQCFDYNKSLGLLATGSNDHMLRFWDPYVTSKPIAVLKTHQACIVGLFIHAPSQMVFSYSKDKHICVFDIKDQVCIQNISIKSPTISKSGEHGPSPLLYTGQSLLIGAETFAAEIKFVEPSLRQSNISLNDLSHPTPVIATIILHSKHQVLTACQSGEIKLWNIRNGQLIDTLCDSNCVDELSAIDVDSSNEWMACGYLNGTANVWNLSKGMKEKSLEKYSSKEIMSVIVLPAMTITFVFGWSRKILAYYDTSLSVSLKPDVEWLSLESHEDDILCAVFIRPMYIATSSFDGDIFLWNIEYKRLVKKIQIGRNQFKWAVSSILFKEPVECLLYLTERSVERYAALVSAEGDTVKFWSTISVGTPTASFEACEKDKVVTALSSDSQNTILVAGDSEGWVRIWHIEGYAGCKRFSEVISQVMQNGHHSGGRSRSTRTSPPHLLESWIAHEGGHVVTSLQIFQNSSEKYLVSAGDDCYIKLWTLKGALMGVFTSSAKWNLDQKMREKKKCRANVLSKETKVGIIFKDDNKVDGNEQKIQSKKLSNSSNEDIESEHDLTSKELQHFDYDDILNSASDTRNQIHKRIDEMKETWSVLGKNYNNDFRARMCSRFNRRHMEPCDKPIKERGGLNICTPFNAVVLKDLDDVSDTTTDLLLLSKDSPTLSKVLGKNIGRPSIS